MSTQTHYVVCIHVANRDKYFLWVDGEGEQDHFAVLPNGKIASAASKDDICAWSKTMGLHVSENKPVRIDLDEVFLLIDRLKTDEPIEKHDCEALINAWNLLEDFAKSIGLIEANGKSPDRLGNLYQRLFFGNNLPSMTPEGKSYSPNIGLKEQKELASYLSEIWRNVDAA